MPGYIGNEPIIGINTRDRFAGDGVTLTFNLSRTASQPDGILVLVSGVVQDSTTYTVVGKTITFQDAPPAAVTGSPTSNIEVVYLNRQGAPLTITAGLSTANFPTYTTTSAIATTDIGSTVLGNSASSITLTLPAANLVTRGATVEVININNGLVTLTRAGADTIQPNSGTITSLAVATGDTVLLRSDGTSKWYMVGGSLTLKYSSNFGSNLSPSGFQKLPSGLIIQWGTFTSATGTGTASGTVTFPLAFPTACTSVQANTVDAGAFINAPTMTTTNFTYNVYNRVTSTAINAVSAYFIAIGY